MRACVGCGCTDDRACPGGCSWASLDPPLCSTCADGGFEYPVEEILPAIACAHQPLFTSATEGYCVRCGMPMSPDNVGEVAA